MFSSFQSRLCEYATNSREWDANVLPVNSLAFAGKDNNKIKGQILKEYL